MRGYRKNLVVFKNLDDGVISEAMFLLRDGADAKDDDIIKEADRIISRSKAAGAIKNARPRFSLPEFLMGIGVAAVAAIIVMIII